MHSTRGAAIVLAGLLACFAQYGSAQPAGQDERVAASFVLALGRTPASSEAEQWGREAPRSLADLLARHRSRLQATPEEQRAVLDRASRDAFGVAQGATRIGGPSATGTYTDVLRGHLRWLAANPDEYLLVVQRAYHAVLARDAYAVEIEYWRTRPATSFALLAACVENWASRNQPGLTATSGVPAVSVNSRYLTAVRLSAAVAAEARAAADLAVAGGPNLAAAIGRHVVAPGAEEIVSVGGIHFAAAGSAALDAGVRQE
jgi:hypothetical protein